MWPEFDQFTIWKNNNTITFNHIPNNKVDTQQRNRLSLCFYSIYLGFILEAIFFSDSFELTSLLDYFAKETFYIHKIFLELKIFRGILNGSSLSCTLSWQNWNHKMEVQKLKPEKKCGCLL